MSPHASYKGGVKRRRSGFSLVEVLIGAALMALVFGGIIGGFNAALVLVGHARASSGAMGLANERIEYLRSLPYDDVGTLLGFVPGNIPQNETVMLNGVAYNRRTFVNYVDSPADGFGGLDSNGIQADYKVAKVELTWTIRGSARSLTLVTNIIPKGIETLAGGGTLIVNVFDAAAAPVANASVRIRNASTTPAIDVTTFSNALGVVMFPGAPAAGGYEISATRIGYSSDQTYSASTSNPNPNPAHVAVVVGNVSTVNLAIDRVSERVLATVELPSADYTEDLFADSSKMAASSSVVVAAGELSLDGAPGSYPPLGIATTTVVSPVGLMSWDEIVWSGSAPAQTETLFRVYAVASSGDAVLVPDADLPGNSAGFASSPVDISALSTSLYPELLLKISLASLDASSTPSISSWRASYTVVSPVPNISITLTGTKNIGTDAFGQPVPKYASAHDTNASGVVRISNLEWDQYTASINGAVEGYDIGDVCTVASLSVAPSSAATTTLVLVPHTNNSFLMRVVTGTGDPIANASVGLGIGGATTTKVTSACGHVYFGGLSSVSAYDIGLSASGYTPDFLSGVSPTGATKLNFTLVP